MGISAFRQEAVCGRGRRPVENQGGPVGSGRIVDDQRDEAMGDAGPDRLDEGRSAARDHPCQVQHALRATGRPAAQSRQSPETHRIIQES